MPRKLDFSKLSTEPKSQQEVSGREEVKGKQPEPNGQQTPRMQAWPSREQQRDGAFTIRGPLEDIDRFKRLCKEDRRTYIDMLRMLMDHADRTGGVF